MPHLDQVRGGSFIYSVPMSSALPDYHVWTPDGWRWQGPPGVDAPLMALDHWDRLQQMELMQRNWWTSRNLEEAAYWSNQQRAALDFWARQKDARDFGTGRCHMCQCSCPGVDAEGRWTSDSVWLWVYPFSADESRGGHCYMVYCIPCWTAITQCSHAR